MCVIIVCPKGVEIPSKETLLKAKSYNNHGFGFVSETKYYRSMCFDDFYENLKSVDMSENVMIHMRFATHGSIKRRNCHPFYKDGVYFAHNGILDVKPIKDMTDSETAFRTKIMKAYKQFGFDSKEFYDYCSWVAGSSKFAIMNEGKIMLIGQYYELEGVYYSNLRFMDFRLHNYANVINM